MSGATRKPQVGDVVMVNGRSPHWLWGLVPPGMVGVILCRSTNIRARMWWVQVSDEGPQRWFYESELLVVGDVR
jgi:hypothetical protein